MVKIFFQNKALESLGINVICGVMENYGKSIFTKIISIVPHCGIYGKSVFTKTLLENYGKNFFPKLPPIISGTYVKIILVKVILQNSFLPKLFPVISGTYFGKKSIYINIYLLAPMVAKKNINLAGGKITAGAKRKFEMKIAETFILWNSNCNSENDGDEIKVLPLGMDDKKYRMTTGGCYAQIRTISDEQKTRFLFIEAMKIIVKYNLDPKAVHNAFCEIKEYRDGLAPDTQIPEHLKLKFESEVRGE